MTPYEFGQLTGAMEKDAINVGQYVNKGVDAVRRTAQRAAAKGTAATRGFSRGMQKNVVDPLTIPLKDRYKAVPLAAKPAAPSRMEAAGRAVRGQAASLYHGTPGQLAGGALDAVGGLGQGVMNTARRGLNKADDLAQYAMGRDARAAGQRFGDQTLGRTQAMAKNIPDYLGGGTSAMTNARNPLNLAVGAGAGAAGLHYGGQALGLGGNDAAEPSTANINNQQLNTQLMQGQHAEAGHGGGLMGMWNSLPIEARYAIGAGVPLALAGAYMGGRGNAGLGGAMGALGLGAAGLGAAGAGMFGDGPRRLVGQGANGLYSMLGGGNSNNPMDQINALGKLSPEFGTTMLMGRDPNMSSEQGRQTYDFLTHNRNIIEQLMPQLQASSTNGVKQGSAREFGEKFARCWAGYEPVPGKKPYSEDSCRPARSKKKKDKKEKKAVSSAARGKTQMTLEPSSRGSKKMIDDKQRETNSPVPTDAKNNQQPHEKVAVPLGALARGVGRMASGAGRAVGAAAQKGVSGVGRGAQMVGGAMTSGGNTLAQGGVNMARSGLQQGGRMGAAKTMAGGAQAALGYGMQGAGTVARGAGTGARYVANKSPLGATMLAGAGAYGLGNSSPAQPYVNHAQEFGRNIYNQAANDIGAGVQGVTNAISSAGNAVGNAASSAGNAASSAGNLIGSAFNTAGSAIGDAAGTAYGTARNSVVNTANNVRRGVNNAAQTARSYVPNVRNPFYYDQAPGMPSGPQM